MIAMQYRIPLPADYDMAIIRRRIAERGHLTDQLGGLAFKAYLHGNHDSSVPGSQNVYAPFYVWRQPEGMSDFLSGPGFAGVVASFGRPTVRTWSVWRAEFNRDLSAASHATQEVTVISPQTDLATLREADQAYIENVLAQGAEAAVSAFDPGQWTLLRFALWRDPQDARSIPMPDAYAVGHISHPNHA